MGSRVGGHPPEAKAFAYDTAWFADICDDAGAFSCIIRTGFVMPEVAEGEAFLKGANQTTVVPPSVVTMALVPSFSVVA